MIEVFEPDAQLTKDPSNRHALLHIHFYLHTVLRFCCTFCSWRFYRFGFGRAAQSQRERQYERILSPQANANFSIIASKKSDTIMMIPGQPTSRELNAAVQSAKQAARHLTARVRRFEIYDFLSAVYRVYVGWRNRKMANRSAGLLARQLSITRRKGTSPIRVLIEATLPEADLRQKSRWVRALEYVASENIPAHEFRRFVRAHHGLAGRARLAVTVNRKRRQPGGDWND